MTVQDLIDILQQYNPSRVVTAWDAYDDCEKPAAVVKETYMGLLISTE
jgi:hypothetical protein